MLEHDKFGMLLLISDNLNEYFEQFEGCIQTIIWLMYHLSKISRSQLWSNPNKSCVGFKPFIRHSTFPSLLNFKIGEVNILFLPMRFVQHWVLPCHRDSHMRWNFVIPAELFWIEISFKLLFIKITIHVV